MLLYLAFLLTTPSAGADGTGSCSASDDSPLAIGKLSDAIETPCVCILLAAWHTYRITDLLLVYPGPHACACSLFRLQTTTTAS